MRIFSSEEYCLRVARRMSFTSRSATLWGARALYLGNSVYRIHGTNPPSTIGQFVSSDCNRLLNDDIEDLYARVTVGRRGEPDTHIGFGITASEFAPRTFTTGQYIGILGDLSNYWIADAMNMQVQQLNELYAETNQVDFIGRLETDGAPVLEEAFVRFEACLKAGGRFVLPRSSFPLG